MLFNVKYLPLFHHFKAIYQFPKHLFFGVKIVANASLRFYTNGLLRVRQTIKSVAERQSEIKRC